MRTLPAPVVLVLVAPALAVLSALAALPVLGAGADGVVDDLLASREVDKRLKAVGILATEGGDGAEEKLGKRLSDPDWEVVERAAAALATRGTSASLERLAGLALGGPVRRVRLAATRALKALDAERGASMIQGRLKGDSLVAAAEALEVLAHPVAAQALERLAKDRGKDATRRLAGTRALAALGRAEDVELFTKLLKDADVRVRAAAVDGLARTGANAAVAPLREGLKRVGMPAVMVRRYISGLRRLLLALGDERSRNRAAKLCARSIGMSGDAKVDARFARLIGVLGQEGAPVGPVDEFVSILEGAGLANADVEVRAASVVALARIGRVDSYTRIGEAVQGDRSPRVRFHALRAAESMRKAGARSLMIGRLRYDDSAIVREEAAAMLGRHRVVEGAPNLIKALDDKAWEVVVSAAISLGKLRTADGVAPLVKLLSHKDWRRRGAAAAGLGWIRQKPAIPPLIGALRDKEPAVSATAREFLRVLSGEAFEGRPKPWREWWARKEKVFVFRDRDEELRQAKKYGYAVQPRKVYEDLDVVVLQTRRGGDNIQFLLDDYGIEYRIVRAASVDKAALHPYALFVANCPGEIVKKDVERLQWFVRSGGYLFSSCWALTHTVEVCFPDIVRKLPTRAQVLDTVVSETCPAKSTFTEGVFDGITRPLWELVGSHLIDVLDAERFEVLLDSPQCATRWGDGNLAGWFSIGHGTVLDSANHFDMQGMKQARVRTEKERMAFAVDHLGYGYEELRKLQAEGVFRKQPVAIKRTRDLSIFRFITTFVREKRKADQQ